MMILYVCKIVLMQRWFRCILLQTVDHVNEKAYVSVIRTNVIFRLKRKLVKNAQNMTELEQREGRACIYIMQKCNEEIGIVVVTSMTLNTDNLSSVLV